MAPDAAAAFAAPAWFGRSAPRPAPGRARATAPRMALADSGVASVGILGASGYTGSELVRLLLTHPKVSLDVLTAERSAGQPLGAVFPQYAFGPAAKLPDLVKIDSVDDWGALDVVFCCLPHATTQEIIASLPLDKVKVVDLSADFRLRDVDLYQDWYGGPHKAPELQKEAVYGLTEWFRDEVRAARLVANPGCYPTAAQLPLIPLLKDKLVSPDDIIIDAKSGATGAGRAAKQGTLFCEVTEGIHAYGVASHRHAPEIEQGLSEAVGADVLVNFTPHLMPMSRGILESIYVKLAPDATVEQLKAKLLDCYEAEPFVHVLPGAVMPQTRHVRGSNHCVMNVVADRVPGRAIIVSVIDNVVKGASGQALHNMNLMCGFDETLGLDAPPIFP